LEILGGQTANKRFSGFFAGLASAWRHRELVIRLAMGELSSVYRGSLFGWFWLVAGQLGLLAFYSVSAAAIGNLATLTNGGGYLSRPLFIFCGLIYFQMFSELLLRAPSMLAGHVGMLKKTIFPTEALAWIALVRSSLSTLILLGILISFSIAVRGYPAPSIVLLPIIFGSFCLTALGIVWALSIIGVFVRDLSHLVASVMPALLLATPLFYSLSDVPESIRPLLYLNPLTFYIEATRDILIQGNAPSWPNLLGALILAVITFHLGYGFFIYARHRAIDAL
jgi:lipopolysaccharide transport system permease protein